MKQSKRIRKRNENKITSNETNMNIYQSLSNLFSVKNSKSITSEGRRSNNRSPADDFWFKKIEPKSGKNLSINHADTLSVTAAWKCLNLYGNLLANLDKNLIYRRVSRKKSLKIADNHPSHWLLKMPNDEMTESTFFKQMIQYLYLYGAYFAVKEYNSSNQLVALHPIHPTRIPNDDHIITKNGVTTYRIQAGEYGEKSLDLPKDEIFHIPRTLIKSKLRGDDPLSYNKDTIATAVLRTQQQKEFLANRSQMDLAIYPADGVGAMAPRVYKQLKTEMKKRQLGMSSAFEPLILPQKVGTTTLTMPFTNSQFYELTKMSVTDICRLFEVYPILVGINDGEATKDTISSFFKQFLIESFIPVVTLIEEYFDKESLNQKSYYTYQHSFSTNDLMMSATIKDPTLYTQHMYSIGAFNINEVRDYYNYDGIGKDGETRMSPANMFTMEQAVALGEISVKKAELDLTMATDIPNNVDKRGTPTVASDTEPKGSVNGSDQRGLESRRGNTRSQYQSTILSLKKHKTRETIEKSICADICIHLNKLKTKINNNKNQEIELKSFIEDYIVLMTKKINRKWSSITNMFKFDIDMIRKPILESFLNKITETPNNELVISIIDNEIAYWQETPLELEFEESLS